jgi:hypothetical protein
LRGDIAVGRLPRRDAMLGQLLGQPILVSNCKN